MISGDNGSNWTASNNGITNANVLALDVVGSTLFAGTNDLGIVFTRTGGSNWEFTEMTNLRCQTFTTISSIIFAGTTSYVFYSADSGLSWHIGGPIGATVLVSRGSTLFAATFGQGVFFSDDSAKNWTPINNGLSYPYVNTITVSGSNIYAGTDGQGVFFSSDNGANWTQVNNGLTDLTVYELIISNSNVYAGTKTGGIFTTTDNGSNWTEVNNSLDNKTIEAFAVKDNNVFAGTDGGGIFFSNDNGANWIAINDGLEFLSINSITILDGNIYAGATIGSVWKRPLSEIITSVPEKDKTLPVNFRLSQNYPNPFNPTTTIKYSIPSLTGAQSSFVRLTVYNALGSQVALLVNKEQAPGNYTVQFDASKLSSGVYYLKMTSDNYISVKKMMLLK